jgi:putative acetyltransferase
LTAYRIAASADDDAIVVAEKSMSTPDVVIRAMSIDDYEAVADLWRRTEGMGLNESDSRPAIAQFLQRNAGMSAIAIDDNRVAGAVLCGHDGRRGYLHHLAVARDRRRRGIAVALLDWCFARLRDAAIPKCNIFLFRDNESGAAFWRHNGWSDRDDLAVLQKTVPKF